MKKALLILTLLALASVALSACSPPPPLKSDKYLKDSSVISTTPCGPPCFQGIVVGQTTFSDAVAKIKASPLFANVQTQENQGKPAQAAWTTAGGEACCQMTTDDKGVINALLVKLTPDVTAGALIQKYGKPDYVTSVDYSQTEVALALIFPKPGVVAWVTPGDPNSTLKPADPVVVVLYLNPADFKNLLDTATLQAWADYLPYQTYKNATPVVTPRVTATPQ
jgi:hypothetical protein